MIAKELDLNPTTICRILKRNNINIKGAGYFNRQYEINENFFNTIDNEEKAYFLGFWYADGYVHSNRTSIRLCLHKQDIDVLLKFKSLVFTGNYELTYAEEDKYISLYVYSHIMRDDLIKHGCGPRKTFNITMPNLPEILMPHFFRGLYDGDGCIYISPKNTVTVRLTGYLPFMKEIQQYMQKHDVSGNSRNVKHKELVGEFAIASQQEVDKMLDYLYKDAIIYLDRKYKKYLRAKEIFREKS
jgi:intein-encoded DNA endonuclease-like protein